MKRIVLTFILTILLASLVLASPRLSTQAEPSYPSPAMMQVYKIERIMLSPIITPLGYAIDTTHEFTKLNYGRAQRFFSPIKPEDKIDNRILEKNGPECEGTFVDVEILFYAPLLKSEEKRLRSIVPDIYIDDTHAGGVIATSDAIKIAGILSVKSIIARSYPSVDVLRGSPPVQSPFSGTCA